MRAPNGFMANRAGVMELLDELVRGEGTDVHLKVPGRPLFRVNGQLVPTHHQRLLPADTMAVAQAVLEMSNEEIPLATVRDHRCAFGIEGVGRFRAQISRQRGSLAIVIHRVTLEPPQLQELGYFAELTSVIEQGHGLVLVAGGRRRHAVIAALIRHYNHAVYGHMVSVEDTMEYLHRDVRAGITQREVGTDCMSVQEGLASAMRQDPDAIAVSDLPEPMDAEMVLRAAEEGLLVICGVPMPDRGDAVRAFTRRFAAAREEEVTSRLGGVLSGTVVVPREGEARFSALDDGARGELCAGLLVRMVG